MPYPLRISHVSLSFGGIVAVDDVSLQLESGAVLGMVGPNGAGKSTLLQVVSGLHTPDRGEVEIGGHCAVGLKPHQISRLGYRYCFQTPRISGQLSVLETMLVGARDRDHCSIRSVLLRPRNTARVERALETKAYTFLERFDMARIANNSTSSLSGGQAKLLSIGQGLMGEPLVLALDEPVAGVHPSFVRSISDILREAKRDGISILVVEHNLRFLEGIADWVVVLADGRLLAEGTMREMRKDARVAEAYLGTGRFANRSKEGA